MPEAVTTNVSKTCEPFWYVNIPSYVEKKQRQICTSAPKVRKMYIVDSVYYVGIPQSTDLRDIGCHTPQYSHPGSQR